MSDRPVAHIEYEELVAGFALDALDPADEERLTAHLESCPRCRALLADFREAAASIAEGIAEHEPSPDLRARILAGASAGTTGSARRADAEQSPPAAGTAKTDAGATVTPLSRRFRMRRVLAAAAAVVVVAGAVTAGLVATGGNGGPPASCTAQSNCTAVTLTSAVSHRRAATVMVLGGTSVWVRAAALPANDAHREIYVLWELAVHRRPLAVGGFDVRAGQHRSVALGALPVPYQRARAFAITLEPGRSIPRAPSSPAVASGAVA